MLMQKLLRQDVDAAVKALNDAIAGLEDYVPPVDKTELAAAIADRRSV